MLVYRRSSLLEAPTQTLVNTVNCVGVMGKGIAKDFKAREPDMFEAYRELCEKKLLEPGKLWLWRGARNWILNFPTKMHWRSPSKIEWIEMGLRKFASSYASQGITEVSFPRLGCGNGGLDWNEVRPLMERYLSELPIEIYVHDYTVDIGLPEHLENIAREIKSSWRNDTSFPGFVEDLRRVLQLANNRICFDELGNCFSARFDSEDALWIESGGANIVYEKDDLRGVWIGLMTGLVTKKKAGCAGIDGATHLISLMRLLPSIRTVELQKHGAVSSELAVELEPGLGGLVSAQERQGQQSFAWH